MASTKTPSASNWRSEFIANLTITPRHFQMAKCHRNRNEFTEALTLYHQALATESTAPDATLAPGTPTRSRRTKECNQMVSRIKLFPRSRNASRRMPTSKRTHHVTWRVCSDPRTLAPNFFPACANCPVAQLIRSASKQRVVGSNPARTI